MSNQTSNVKGTHHSKLVRLVPVVLFFGLLVMLFFRLGDDTKLVPHNALNKPIPEFSLPSLISPEKQISNADLPKQPFILNVWGSWCPSCYTEHPFLVELANKKVNFVGVNYQDEMADALQYLEKLNNPYSLVLQDYEGKLSLNLGLTGAPESFLVDAQGNIRQHIVGKITPENWQARIAPCWKALHLPKSNESDNQISQACQ